MCPSVCPELQVLAAAHGRVWVQGRDGKWCAALSTGYLQLPVRSRLCREAGGCLQTGQSTWLPHRAVAHEETSAKGGCAGE